MPLQLSGMIPPAVSPLTARRTADREGIGRLTERLLDGGASGVFVLGSCGEGPTLEPGVARAVVAGFVEAVDGRVPVLAGVGETSTERAVAAAAAYEEAGVDALVVMAPMYFDTETDGAVVRHFEGVAARTSSPLVAYNIPHLTHSPITPDALAEIAGIDAVIALKESSADWEVFSALADTAREHGLGVFQGAEALIARSLAEGADGAVPGIANLVPGLASRLVAAGLAHDTEQAARLQAELDVACGIYGAGFWLSSLKGALAELGVIGPALGEALPALEPGQARVLRERLAAVPGILDGAAA
ncbi:dihydrodipicolinate synthase family protein [Herbiconiux moechotypicola]|uniref:Dihydrodipicolinate synthase family protein n=1 Tax=Herbiconiux moechotypicola TaxID=637393 RepID=A0ABN3E6X8_9MICO|nr:dihydrodipicolinate synthase family protein [Herbiconiux moechotypicola]MCS5731895.1 dihydrodipicolinate synthase family protein [Herbiconiux moechotypicola]